MPLPLVECIPNFSEGRRPEIVEQIVCAAASVAGVKVLDCHSDPDHNRTVLTLLGNPQAVKTAAFQVVQKAAELIDMDQHRGEHPRMGATDVVPFVPIRDIEMQACVQLARELGQQIGEQLGIPVYLYEAAAARPERVNLEDVRRGQYEGLKDEIDRLPERAPDFGPKVLGKAGAVIIGAREALIAFNVYLSSDDVAIAKKIAKMARFSSGGLRYVKAMGVLVEGRAQVSMNLTNYRQTALATVLETIRREALRHGVQVHHTELVGLIPQQAMLDAAVWYTQMDGFESTQILENKLQESSLTGQSRPAYPFLDDLASASPTPGGGSAAAFSAAQAAALTAMVARLTLGKAKYASVEEEMGQILEKAEGLRAELTAAIQEDADSFEGVMQAFKLPKDSPKEKSARQNAIQAATLVAAQVPLRTCRLALQVMHLASVAAEFGNLNAVTDAWSAVEFAFASLASAAANVRINLSGMNEEAQSEVHLLEDEIGQLEQQAHRLRADTKPKIEKRANINLL